MTSRAPGMIAAALTSRAKAGFICDGHHVSDATLKVALSVQGAKDRMFFVSDAMPTVGGPNHFCLYDMEVSLKDGKLINSEGGLAGAHTTMSASMSRAVKFLGLSAEDVLRMGISSPAGLMGLEDVPEVVGAVAGELLLWSDDLRVCNWLDGGTAEDPL